MNLRGRVRRLEKLLGQSVQRETELTPIPSHSPEALVRLEKLVNQMGVECPDLSEAETVAIKAALQENTGRLLSAWLCHLRRGDSAIPEDLAPATLLRLFRVYLTQDCDWITMVCDGCGLERPTRQLPPLSQWRLKPGCDPSRGDKLEYDLPPDFFAACPHCGEVQWTWSTRINERERPWQVRASHGKLQ